MAERASRRGLAILSLVAAVVAAFLMLARSHVTVVDVSIALLAMIVGALVAPSVSSGNRFTLTMAVAAALPFVFEIDGAVNVAGVEAIYLLAFVVLAVIESFRSHRFVRSVGYALRHLAGYSTFVVTLAAVRGAVGESLGATGWEVLVPFIAGGVAWFIVEVALWSLLASEYRRVSARYLALAGLKDINVFVSLVATGGLFGLTFGALDWWALPVALLPYSLAHGAFRRFHETKATYKQTIRALAQIPEAAGLNLSGHADRTSGLSVAMAKDLGLSPEEVEDVDFAALMHDIGRITLNEPTVVEQGWTDDDIARWGAEIIAGAPSLDRVAGYVRRQYEPFRKPGEVSDPAVSTIARIVKIASAYDAHVSGGGLSELQALEELHQGAAYEYDPEVVASLRRVLGHGIGRHEVNV
jgi:hypothetical protein